MRDHEDWTNIPPPRIGNSISLGNCGPAIEAEWISNRALGLVGAVLWGVDIMVQIYDSLSTLVCGGDNP